jgi:hypothetical protein
MTGTTSPRHADGPARTLGTSRLKRSAQATRRSGRRRPIGHVPDGSLRRELDNQAGLDVGRATVHLARPELPLAQRGLDAGSLVRSGVDGMHVLHGPVGSDDDPNRNMHPDGSDRRRMDSAKIEKGRAKGYSLLSFAISLPATARMRRARADERRRGKRHRNRNPSCAPWSVAAAESACRCHIDVMILPTACRSRKVSPSSQFCRLYPIVCRQRCRDPRFEGPSDLRAAS